MNTNRINEIYNELDNCDLELEYYDIYEPYNYDAISALEDRIYELQDELKTLI